MLCRSEAVILCRNVQVLCKRSDVDCYSSPCAKAAPDLFTIIDDDLDDVFVYRPGPAPVELPQSPLVPPRDPPQATQPEAAQPESTVPPQFKDDAVEDFVNEDAPRRAQSQIRRISPVESEGHFVSVHDVVQSSPDALGGVSSARALFGGLAVVWLATCFLFICLRNRCCHKAVRTMEKDGAVMVELEDESDDSSDEPDEYVTTPEPPSVRRHQDV